MPCLPKERAPAPGQVRQGAVHIGQHDVAMVQEFLKVGHYFLWLDVTAG
jgi:hypothetical protein